LQWTLKHGGGSCGRKQQIGRDHADECKKPKKKKKTRSFVSAKGVFRGDEFQIRSKKNEKLKSGPSARRHVRDGIGCAASAPQGNSPRLKIRALAKATRKLTRISGERKYNRFSRDKNGSNHPP